MEVLETRADVAAVAAAEQTALLHKLMASQFATQQQITEGFARQAEEDRPSKQQKGEGSNMQTNL
jgi:hypothetical protein